MQSGSPCFIDGEKSLSLYARGGVFSVFLIKVVLMSLIWAITLKLRKCISCCPGARRPALPGAVTRVCLKSRVPGGHLLLAR